MYGGRSLQRYRAASWCLVVEWLKSAGEKYGKEEARALGNGRKGATDAEPGKYIPGLRVFQAILCITYPAARKIGG